MPEHKICVQYSRTLYTRDVYKMYARDINVNME
jgi:hypothetical protein